MGVHILQNRFKPKKKCCKNHTHHDRQKKPKKTCYKIT